MKALLAWLLMALAGSAAVIHIEGPLPFPVGVGSGTVSACGTNGPVLMDENQGTKGPYPWNLAVSGLLGPVTSVTVTLTNLTHAFPSDLHFLLVSPNGTAMKFYGAAGGELDVTNVTITLADAATDYLPEPLVTGTYKPTEVDPSYVFPAGPPVGPYATNFSVFTGMAAGDANGLWLVYAADAVALDGGSLTNVCVNVSY